MKHGPPRRRASHRPGRHRAPSRVGLRGPAGLALLGTFVMVSSGVAAAYWSAGGSGSGSVTAGTAAPLTTVTATASTTSLLYPGGPAADLSLTVRNANPYAVSITGLSANGAVTAAGGIGTCVTTGVSLTTPTAGLPFTVPARAAGTDGSITVSMTAAAQMTSASENGCQGATFTVPVTLIGQGS